MSKVVLLKCSNYDVDLIYNKIQKAVELLGGLNKFIKKNEKIVLKPNMLLGKSPEKAATTNPVFFEAVIKYFSNNNINISYGDSPGFGKIENVVKKTGLYQIAKKYSIKLDDFSKGKSVKYNNGQFHKDFEIANAVLNSNGIINLPKMKTHQFARLTGAVKNLFGCIYGFHKAAFHAKYHSPVDFSKMLVDLAGYLKPRLNIMDGITAMEGNGPGSGTPVNMNCIIVSDDPVALDSVFCRLIDFNPEYITTNTYGEEIGLGVYNYKKIEIIGDDINELINKKFKIVRRPLYENKHRAIFVPIVDKIIPHPRIKKNKCVKCGICIDACPLEKKAVFFKNKNKPPVYDYNECIRCYCCQEMCPHKAIYIKRPLLGRIFIKSY